MSNLPVFRPLYEPERQVAREAAQEFIRNLSGRRPQRHDFDGYTVSRYPAYVQFLITLLCTVVLIAAFVPSAIRIYDIGSKTFAQAIGDPVSPGAVGIAIIILSEAGQVVSTLALAVLGSSKYARILLLLAAGAFTLIALSGNVEVADPWAHKGLFIWLEALAPPCLVLSMAYVLKEQALHGIQRRHADNLAYLQALAEWKDKTQDPEAHPEWKNAYANALRDEIRKVAQRSLHTKEIVQGWGLDEWRARVASEMRAHEWFIEPPVEAPVTTVSLPEPPIVIPPASNRLKPPVPYLYGSSIDEVEGLFTATCPKCSVVLGTTYKSKQYAHNGILSHLKAKHKDEGETS